MEKEESVGKIVLESLAKGVLLSLVAGAVGGLCMIPGKGRRTEPVMKAVRSSEARIYYGKWSQIAGDKEKVDSTYTFAYIDEKPYGSLDYVVKLEKRKYQDLATRAWSPSTYDIETFERIAE